MNLYQTQANNWNAVTFTPLAIFVDGKVQGFMKRPEKPQASLWVPLWWSSLHLALLEWKKKCLLHLKYLFFLMTARKKSIACPKLWRYVATLINLLKKKKKKCCFKYTSNIFTRPIQPSSISLHASSDFIEVLWLCARLSSRKMQSFDLP